MCKCIIDMEKYSAEILREIFAYDCYSNAVLGSMLKHKMKLIKNLIKE